MLYGYLNRRIVCISLMKKILGRFFHSYAFDFSVWEIWGALLYGGKLVVVPYWISRSPKDFLSSIGGGRSHSSKSDTFRIPPINTSV